MALYITRERDSVTHLSSVGITHAHNRPLSHSAHSADTRRQGAGHMKVLAVKYGGGFKGGSSRFTMRYVVDVSMVKGGGGIQALWVRAHFFSPSFSRTLSSVPPFGNKYQKSTFAYFMY